jgi:AraC-like DNA-binding protein
MAERASLSRRSFDRRFRSATGSAPLQWLNAQRVMYAQRMLESTDLPMDQVALRSGFGSLVAMRGHFRRHLSTSPTAYRQTFRGALADSGGDSQHPSIHGQIHGQSQGQPETQPSSRPQAHVGFPVRDGA